MPPNNARAFGPLAVEVTQTVIEILVLILQILFSYVLSVVNIFIQTPKSVKGEIVLITGAGHGMGKELALLYASEGATVVIWDINKENGTKTVEEIAKHGYPKAYFYFCDVSKRENVLNVGKEVQAQVGDVTILINNAGIMPTHGLLDHGSEEIERIININLMAHFWTLEAFLPSMKKHNYGHIVCLSSCAGIFGFSNLVPYCATKFAVRGLMEALHEELRLDKKNEIKITSICPYMVDTGLCKRPYIRFENLMPIVKPKDAAKEIINAQRLNVDEITIPRYIHVLNRIGRLMPVRAQMHLIDFMRVGLHSDLN